MHIEIEQRVYRIARTARTRRQRVRRRAGQAGDQRHDRGGRSPVVHRATAADFFEREVDEAVASLSSLLEPLIMAILGVLVGGMVTLMAYVWPFTRLVY